MKTRTIRLMMLFGVLIYILLFHLSYIYFISPSFSYWGYIFEPPSLGYWILEILLALCPLIWMPVNVSRPSQIIYWALYLGVYIPTLFIPFHTLRTPPMTLLGFGAVLLFCLWGINLIYRLPLVQIPEPRVKVSNFTFWSFIIALSVFSYGYLVYSFGFGVEFVGLFEVYGVRAGYRSVLVEKGRLIAYVIGMQSGALNPFLIAYGLMSRRMLVASLGIFGGIYIYGITGAKTALLTPFGVLALFLILNSSGARFGIRLVYGAVGLVLMCLVIDLVMYSNVMSVMIVSRVIITPGLLTGFYFDFFQENPLLYLSHSVFSRFVDYPYNMSPPQLIGYVYFQRFDLNANANLWADAYANFGYSGVFVFTGLLAMVFWVLDSLSRKLPLRLVGLMLSIHALTLANSGLLTSILTHGIALTGLLIYLMPKSVWLGGTSARYNNRTGEIGAKGLIRG